MLAKLVDDTSSRRDDTVHFSGNDHTQCTEMSNAKRPCSTSRGLIIQDCTKVGIRQRMCQHSRFTITQPELLDGMRDDIHADSLKPGGLDKCLYGMV